jgi:hypothetical protein
MSEKELWEAYSTRNPSFNGDQNVTMSAAGLPKLFRQTWSIAFDTGMRDGIKQEARRHNLREELQSRRQSKSSTGTGFGVFDQIFNGQYDKR